MPSRSIAERITRELKDEADNDSSETYIVFYDFHGDPPSSRFYTNLERLKDPESHLIQYSVFHTTSQNTARAVKQLAEHYGAEALIFQETLLETQRSQRNYPRNHTFTL